MLKLSTKKDLTPVIVKEESTEYPSVVLLLGRVMELLNREQDRGKRKDKAECNQEDQKDVNIARQLNRQPEHLCHLLTKTICGERNVNREGQ